MDLKETIIAFESLANDKPIHKNIFIDFGELEELLKELESYRTTYEQQYSKKVLFGDLKEFEFKHCAEYEIFDNCEECEYYNKGCVNKLIDDNFIFTKLIK